MKKKDKSIKKSPRVKKINTSLDLKKNSRQFQTFLNKHNFLVLVLFSGLMLTIAITVSQKYLKPIRDENAYNKGLSEIIIKQIDQQKLQELTNSLDDTKIDVGPNFVPDRDNPFAE